MKIVNIFASTNLYAFHFDGQKQNELDRLLDSWNDTSYLYKYIRENKNDLPKNFTPTELIEKLSDDANFIDEEMYSIAKDKTRKLDEFFKPLYNQEYKIVELSLQKGRKNFLRIYAIKIDTDLFVITGGAIKFKRLMNDADLAVLSKCRDFLKNKGIFDSDSFTDYIHESK